MMLHRRTLPSFTGSQSEEGKAGGPIYCLAIVVVSLRCGRGGMGGEGQHGDWGKGS